MGERGAGARQLSHRKHTAEQNAPCHHLPELSSTSRISPLAKEISLGSSGEAESVGKVEGQHDVERRKPEWTRVRKVRKGGERGKRRKEKSENRRKRVREGTHRSKEPWP
jgi:hypothetical protein